jgi:hypothetical protein
METIVIEKKLQWLSGRTHDLEIVSLLEVRIMGLLNVILKPEVLCHSRCGMLKNPHCYKSLVLSIGLTSQSFIGNSDTSERFSMARN